ncbi:MAG TPA: biotin--[acetyl-CoA-carboxylase] ligase [Thermoanaerobaculia bacterium]|nr:biotin--[acetyl-CoA-carboxylase] ligase [Thermoanaerobaculia bacterium]
MSPGDSTATNAAAGREPASGYPAWLAALSRRAAEVGGAARPWAANRVLLSGLGSTNALARRVVDEYLAEDLALPAAAFVAWEQSAGRGRHGRSWSSPPGAGAWVTLLRPVASVEELSRLPLLVPLGLCEGLDAHLPDDRPCGIKWPNDLVVDGRKIGGVLIDGVAPRGGEAGSGAAVIGFGVNLLQDDAELAPLSVAGALPATSVTRETGEAVPVAEVLWDLVEAVATRLASTGDAAAAVADYSRRSIHSPGEVLRCRSGEETLEGRFRGFDRNGFLRLELSAPGAGRERGDEVLMRAGEVVA